jgi:superoxide dismutase, Cu-Zn family
MKTYMRSLTSALGLSLWLLPVVVSAQMNHGGLHEKSPSKAVAVLAPTEGHKAFGIVTFTAVDSGVRVVGEFSGLTPGKHGFHIHEFGDCSAPDGTSAGGHFNPTNMPHSTPTSGKRHIGDMGNVEAGKDGTAFIDYVDTTISLSGEYSIIGRGLIVHEKEDDLTTQPTGAAGARIACGVVGVGKP